MNEDKMKAERKIKDVQIEWLCKLLQTSKLYNSLSESFVESFTQELLQYLDDGLWPESLYEEVQSLVDIVIDQSKSACDIPAFISKQVDIRGIQDRFYSNLLV